MEERKGYIASLTTVDPLSIPFRSFLLSTKGVACNARESCVMRRGRVHHPSPPLPPSPPNRGEEEESVPIRKIHRFGPRPTDPRCCLDRNASFLPPPLSQQKGLGLRREGGWNLRGGEMMSPQGMANLMTADWLCMGYMNGWPLLPSAILFPRLLASLESPANFAPIVLPLPSISSSPLLERVKISGMEHRSISIFFENRCNYARSDFSPCKKKKIILKIYLEEEISEFKFLFFFSRSCNSVSSNIFFGMVDRVCKGRWEGSMEREV